MMLTSLSTTTATGPSASSTKPGTSKPSQPGMIGGFVGRPVACSTGPGTPMPTPARSLGVRPVAVTRRAAVLDDPAQHGVGAEGDVEVDDLVGEHRRRQVGDGEADVGRPDVGGEHDTSRRVEGELRRRAAARRGRLAGRADERARQQGVDALGDRRAAEAARRGQLAARPRDAVAEVLQQGAGAVHVHQ